MKTRLALVAVMILLALPVLAGPVDQAMKQLEAGDHDAALATLNEAPEDVQATSDWHLWFARANLAKLQTVSFMEKGPFARQALEHLEKAIEIDPANVEARATLGGYYLNAPPIAGGSTELALEQAQAIVEYDAVTGHAMMAGIHQKEERYPEATAAFAKVLEEDPENRGALYQTGKIAAVTGENLAAGQACLEKYLELDVEPGYPGHGGAHWRLGMILEHEGDTAGARAHYEKAVAMDPESEQFRASLEALDAEG
jgi:tetratricopeptide (TPR) repeat protein